MATNNLSNRTGVLLVNLGTPESPNTKDVRTYLRQFLMDGRVIDFPWLARFLLVNGIIAPFRAPKSAKIYKEVWTDKGSPLKFHGVELANQIQQKLGDNYMVRLAMRYQQPCLKDMLGEFKKAGLKRIVVLPLFPQYASASTGSVQQLVMEQVSQWQIIPEISFISQFFDNPGFIETFAQLGRAHLESHHYDHVIFTYHGLPQRQIRKGDQSGKCLIGDCCEILHDQNQYCYRAQCVHTSKLLAARLGLDKSKYTVSFQSRLGRDPWLLPYTDKVLVDLVKSGHHNILAFSPSFVADCLETTIEIGLEYKELFEEAGGKHWQLVESLNTHPVWVDAVAKMITEKAGNPVSTLETMVSENCTT